MTDKEKKAKEVIEKFNKGLFKVSGYAPYSLKSVKETLQVALSLFDEVKRWRNAYDKCDKERYEQRKQIADLQAKLSHSEGEIVEINREQFNFLIEKKEKYREALDGIYTIAEQALSKSDECPKCNGCGKIYLGEDAHEERCPKCNGTGRTQEKI